MPDLPVRGTSPGSRLDTARAVEYAEFASAMTDKLKGTDREVRELSGTLVLAEKRAAEAEHRVKREARRATDSEAKVQELEVELDIRKAERGGPASSLGRRGRAAVPRLG